MPPKSKHIMLSKRSARKLVRNVGVGATQPIDATIPKQYVREYLSVLSKIYMGHCAGEDMVRRVTSHIKSKLRGYVAQDTAMGRDPTHNATIEETTHKLIGSALKCCYCEHMMGVGGMCGTIDSDPAHSPPTHSSQWTLDRIDNMLPHTNENTVIACLGCNLKRGTMAHDVFVKNMNGYFSECKKLKPLAKVHKTT